MHLHVFLFCLLWPAAAAAPEHCTAAEMPRVSLGDGSTIPAVGFGLYYTPPGASVAASPTGAPTLSCRLTR